MRALFAALVLVATQDARRENPDLPPRDSKGRLDAGEFFKRYPGHKLSLVSEWLIPDRDFGVRRPGERFGNGWMVAAQGEKVGINHKTAPVPTAEMICEGRASIRPDGGCG